MLVKVVVVVMVASVFVVVGIDTLVMLLFSVINEFPSVVATVSFVFAAKGESNDKQKC